ncbi:Bud-site selection protein [Teratosphaeria nubilosa]|uniref:Bud-site selection protein n=1 Tax=Teratosphaeria nubilosa TaxID=161662 RepID=A0A6G1LHL1_9PEZI|nr:Bud-site selection protein [Teratosphaeria nubilosa]
MPKRKREAGDDGGGQGVPLGAAQQRVQHKLKQGVVKLGHAFKIAKGFERQKLSRRLKTAQSGKKELDEQRIHAEISAIKTLNTSASAQHFLYNTLSKIKAVAASPKLPTKITELSVLSTNASLLNVHARLCNSNPVKDALQPVLKDIGKSLGVDVSKDDGLKKKRLRAKDYEDAAAKEKPAGKSRLLPSTNASDSDSDSENDDEQHAGDLERQETDDSEDDLAQFNDRLASSEDEDDGCDSDDQGVDGSDIDIDVLEKQLAAEGARQSKSTFKHSKPTKYDHTADLSLSESEDGNGGVASPEPRKASAPKKSAFIPSLTLGGYISGSGSDIDDDLDIAPKKNRRGQQARRAIAEKKYGSKAKHLQKQNQKRDSGWDSKRGATDRDADRRHGRGRPGFVGNGAAGARSGGGKASGGELREKMQQSKHRDDSGPIHPSWEAAKKAKERKEAPVPFQGKKITFD